jgi:hypothetical protein
MTGAGSGQDRSTNYCDHVLNVRDENVDPIIYRTSESTKNRRCRFIVTTFRERIPQQHGHEISQNKGRQPSTEARSHVRLSFVPFMLAGFTLAAFFPTQK